MLCHFMPGSQCFVGLSVFNFRVKHSKKEYSDYLNLNMKTMCSFKMVKINCPTTRCHSAEDLNPNSATTAWSFCELPRKWLFSRYLTPFAHKYIVLLFWPEWSQRCQLCIHCGSQQYELQQNGTKSIIGTVIRLCGGQSGFYWKRFCFSAKCSHHFWGQPSLLFNWQQRFSPCG